MFRIIMNIVVCNNTPNFAVGDCTQMAFGLLLNNANLGSSKLVEPLKLSLNRAAAGVGFFLT